jgi:hypothetical protein
VLLGRELDPGALEGLLLLFDPLLTAELLLLTKGRP